MAGFGFPSQVELIVALAVASTVAGALGATLAGARYRRFRVRNRLVADRVPSGRVPEARRWAPRWFVRRIDDMALAGDPARWWRRSCSVAAIAIGACGLAGGPVLALVAGLAGLVAVAMVIDLNRDRADRLVDAGLPAVLDRVAAGLRAGLALPVALRDSTPVEPGPLRGDLVALTAALDAGVPLARCLAVWRSRRPTPGTRLVTAAVALCAVLGGRSRPLDGVASTLRDHLAIDREVRAASAQARASAVVLLLTPWGFVGFSAARDPEVIGFFAGSPVGLACLVVGVSLDLCGGWLMARTIRAVT